MKASPRGPSFENCHPQSVAANSQQNTQWSSRRCLVLLKALVLVHRTIQLMLASIPIKNKPMKLYF